MTLEATLEDLVPRLLRYCRGRLGDPQLAEEIAQEALTALVGRWRHRGAPDDPIAFTFVIARRRAARLRRRRWLERPLETVQDKVASEPSPEQELLAGDSLRWAIRALDRLRKSDRETLLLSGAGGLDMATAAKVLGVSTSAYKMRLHRARRRLQQQLEKVHAPQEGRLSAAGR